MAKRISFATFNRNFLPCSSPKNRHIGVMRLCYVEWTIINQFPDSNKWDDNCIKVSCRGISKMYLCKFPTLNNRFYAVSGSGNHRYLFWEINFRYKAINPSDSCLRGEKYQRGDLVRLLSAWQLELFCFPWQLPKRQSFENLPWKLPESRKK